MREYEVGEGAEGRRATPDLTSLELQRRAFYLILVLLTGFLIGTGVLSMARGGGSVGWLAVAAVASAVLAILVIAYHRGRVDSLFSWLIVGFFLVCWIAVGTPSVAEGQSGGGSKSLFISQAGLTVLLVLRAIDLVLRGGRSEGRAPLFVPIAAYLAVCVLSTVLALLFPNEAVTQFSMKTAVPVNALELATRFLALGGLLMVGARLRGRALPFGAAAILVPGLLTFSGLFGFLSSSLFTVFPQIISMSVLAAFSLSDPGRLRTGMRLAAGGVALSIVATYFLKGTDWVSGWAAALIALVIVCWHLNRRLLVAGVAVLFLVVAIHPVYFYSEVYEKNFYGKFLKPSGPDRGREYSAFDNDRLRMLKGAFLYAERFPFGIGPGNYRAYNHYFGRPEVWNTTTFTSAHGTYTQALAETGWPGLAALLAILFGACRMMFGYVRRFEAGSWQRTYVLGVAAACVGTFFSASIGDYLFPTYHNGGLTSFGNCVYTWLAIGVTMAMGQVYGGSEERSVEEEAPVAARWRRGSGWSGPDDGE
ncbi:MAG: O-antigen ligase family protein [Capsulimonadales bacterium]|nr:O-antigen ligase family protein [Capsulimonadales bacterium]